MLSAKSHYLSYQKLLYLDYLNFDNWINLLEELLFFKIFIDFDYFMIASFTIIIAVSLKNLIKFHFNFYWVSFFIYYYLGVCLYLLSSSYFPAYSSFLSSSEYDWQKSIRIIFQHLYLYLTFSISCEVDECKASWFSLFLM